MKEQRILLFAGTTEGRQLFERLTEQLVQIDVCVATEYGKELLDKNSDNIFAKRLDLNQMKELLKQNDYSLVIDATHPYATVVTQNIKAACQDLGRTYLRLLREESDCEDAIYCETLSEAVAFLASHEGNVLSTIGSKELSHFVGLAEFQKRIFARILPLPEAVNDCFSLGFQGRNLICMQGPFSCEMNIAMLRQLDCRYLLTKNSGAVGGFDEKREAAKATNTKLIVIGRPTKEEGLSLDEVIKLLLGDEPVLQGDESPRMDYFPLFLKLADKTALVVGGGKIATRRIETLAKFSCKIRLVSKSITKELEQLVAAKKLEYHNRPFDEADLEGTFLVVAATNDRTVNQRIGHLAEQKGIYHSIADCKEECDFFFPAIIQKGQTVIGVTAEGKSHRAAAMMADKIRRLTDGN